MLKLNYDIRKSVQRIIAAIERLSETTILVCIRQGLMLVLPLIIAGAAALLLLYIPIPGVQNFFDKIMGEKWRTICEFIQMGSFGISSLAVIISISISYAKQYNIKKPGSGISSTITAAISLSCYFVIAIPMDGVIAKGFFSLSGGGFPIALLVTITAPPLFIFLSERHLFERFMSAAEYDSTVKKALISTPAGVLTIFIFGFLRMLLEISGIHNTQEMAQHFFSFPFYNAGNSIGTGIAYISISQFLWFFGIHGPNVLALVERTILIPASADNIVLAALGLSPGYILTKPFIDAFVHIGGSGATLSLILAILLKSNDHSTRRLGLIALLPALFNVNEIILFGIPIVLNPVYAIPFLIVPVIDFIAAYAATTLDLVPKTIHSLHWTAPPLFGGYAATGSFSGLILQLFNITLGVLIYLPFVGITNNIQKHRFQKILDRLFNASVSNITGPTGKKCIDLPGADGSLARTLANELKKTMEEDDQLYLEFQPIIDVAGKTVTGAEALLRWKHPIYGIIPPPVTVSLAEDTGIIGRLGMRILHDACRQHAIFEKATGGEKIISINMSAPQFEMMGIVDYIKDELKGSGLRPEALKLEITESIALLPESRILKVLRELHDLGIHIAIDDFGMGHTSLRYIQEFPIDTVKIDKSLTQESSTSVNEHIIQSIVGLCEALGIQIIVEGVETENQLERFKAHRCFTFQGYLFSKPLSGEAYIDFVKNSNALLK